jgi:uncharacterized protein
MNILQKLDISLNLFVSLNPYHKPKKKLTHKVLSYEHPIFNIETEMAQKKISSIQGINNVFHTGAWTNYGFHEDGIKSAVKVVKKMNVQIPWELN